MCEVLGDGEFVTLFALIISAVQSLSLLEGLLQMLREYSRDCGPIQYEFLISRYLELLIYGYMTRNFTDQLSVSHQLSFTF